MLDIYFRFLKDIYLKYVILYIPKSITPNFLTFLSLIFGLIGCIFNLNEDYMIGLVLWWVGRIFDGLDGN